MLILLLALFLRLPMALVDFIPFVFDTGRDMVWVRDMVALRRPYLIGPWGSLAGIFLGPAWYYLLVIPFVITGGDPKGSVFLVLFFNLLTIFLAFVFGKKIKGKNFALILVFLLLLSPLMVNICTYAFHANLLPLTTLIFIWSLYQCLQGEKKFLILASLMASFNFHLEPAMAVFTTLTLLVFLILKFKSLKLRLKDLLLPAVSFSLPFVPQIIFELRHNFLQTKALIGYFKGENESLGGKLPLFPRIIDRFEKFIRTFRVSIIATNQFLVVILFLLTMFLIWKIYQKERQKVKNLIFVLVLSLLIPFLGFTFLFLPELKGWYLYGLVVIYAFLVALILDTYLDKPRTTMVRGKSKILYLLFLFLFFTNSFPITRVKDLFRGYEVGGPELLKNQKNAIDWIYQDAEEKPFKVFVYTAPVYDYHYQYLFWWYGEKKFGYLPLEYSYLPGETSYVPHKEHYVNPHPQETDLVYLIIEPEEIEERLNGWFGHFSDTKLEKRIKLNSGIVIEKRKE